MGKPLISLRRLEFQSVTSLPTTLPEFGSRSFTFLVGFEPPFYFLESEISTHSKGHCSNNLPGIPYIQRGQKVSDPVVPAIA